jgi:deoxyribodipyrimidine photo-lyase
MLQGLRDVDSALKKRSIRFIVRRGRPSEIAVGLAKEASLVVCDRGYTRHQKAWRDHVADHAGRRVIEVESDAIVPVEAASEKQEYGARTIRPRLHRHWPEFFIELSEGKVKHSSIGLKINGDIDVSSPDTALAKLKVDRSVPVSPYFTGGQEAAKARLQAFIAGMLDGYAEGRNEPVKGQSSSLSAYLQFGHISPLEMALAARDAKGISAADRDSFIEELGVRRELAVNFIHYCPKYDSYDCLPDWAKKTLSEHRRDVRKYLYTIEELEAAATHDEYWNAAQREMVATGFMHNYMRMYWGKKVLEWGRSPEEAYATLLHLNNKWFLCGRGPNAFANVGWIFGLHDRAWGPERPIFGKIRYMNAAGLERKFDIAAYVKKTAAL